MIKTPKKILQRGGSSLLFDNAAVSSLKLKSQEASEFNTKEQNDDDQALVPVEPSRIGVKEIKSIGKRTVVPTPDQLSKTTKKRIQE